MRPGWAGAAALSLFAVQAAQAQQDEPGTRCQPQDLSRLTGWNGVWMAEHMLAEVNGRQPPGTPSIAITAKLLGLDAPWNDAGWDVLEERVAAGTIGNGQQSGWGFPLMMSSPAPFTIVVSPTQTVMVSEYRDVRYIFTDGRGHLPEEDRWPTIFGDSTGCWEGDTLAIETIGVGASPAFNPIAPQLSDNAHFVERIRMTGPDRLESDITITDPERLERPWNVHMVYLRHPVIDRLVHEGDTLENNRTVLEGGMLTIAPPAEAPETPPALPPAPKLSAAELSRVAGRYVLEGAPIQFTFESRGNRMFYRVDPPQPFFLPIRSVDPLTFNAGGTTFHFTVGPDGDVTGFTGESPEGLPMNAARSPGRRR